MQDFNRQALPRRHRARRHHRRPARRLRGGGRLAAAAADRGDEEGLPDVPPLLRGLPRRRDRHAHRLRGHRHRHRDRRRARGRRLLDRRQRPLPAPARHAGRVLHRRVRHQGRDEGRAPRSVVGDPAAQRADRGPRHRRPAHPRGGRVHGALRARRRGLGLQGHHPHEGPATRHQGQHDDAGRDPGDPRDRARLHRLPDPGARARADGRVDGDLHHLADHVPARAERLPARGGHADGHLQRDRRGRAADRADRPPLRDRPVPPRHHLPAQPRDRVPDAAGRPEPLHRQLPLRETGDEALSSGPTVHRVPHHRAAHHDLRPHALDVAHLVRRDRGAHGRRDREHGRRRGDGRRRRRRSARRPRRSGRSR